MRELANSSARTAITRANKRKHAMSTLASATIGIVCLVLGIGLLACSIVMQSWMLGLLGVCFLASGAYGSLKVLRQLTGMSR